MSELLFVCLIAAITFAGSLAFGSLPYLSVFSSSGKLLQTFTGIAAGFLLGAALLIAIPEGFGLFLESVESAGESHAHGETLHLLVKGGYAVLAGFLLMLLLEGFGFGHDIHEEHHDHGHVHGHEHVNHPKGRPTAVVIGLSIHAFTDGLVIGAAVSQMALVVTLQLALVILAHKMPAAFSVTAFSLHERNRPARAKWDLILFSLATPLAIFVSWGFLRELDSVWSAYAMLFSAGTFLYVATVDVLPQMHDRVQARHVMGTVCFGILFMLVLILGVEALSSAAHLH